MGRQVEVRVRRKDEEVVQVLGSSGVVSVRVLKLSVVVQRQDRLGRELQGGRQVKRRVRSASMRGSDGELNSFGRAAVSAADMASHRIARTGLQAAGGTGRRYGV